MRRDSGLQRQQVRRYLWTVLIGLTLITVGGMSWFLYASSQGRYPVEESVIFSLLAVGFFGLCFLVCWWCAANSPHRVRAVIGMILSVITLVGIVIVWWVPPNWYYGDDLVRTNAALTSWTVAFVLMALARVLRLRRQRLWIRAVADAALHGFALVFTYSVIDSSEFIVQLAMCLAAAAVLAMFSLFILHSALDYSARNAVDCHDYCADVEARMSTL